MAYELVYTSAERGLKPGTRGFCTVACTRGIPPQTMQLLEALSAYKNLYGVHEAAYTEGPVAWSHIISNFVGRRVNVLSRVGATSPDHTGRSNKLAHHIVLSLAERVPGGPAWLSSQEGVFLDTWTDEPHYIEAQRRVPTGDYAEGRADSWEALTGDAGHAALLPQMFLEKPDRIVYIIYAPGTEMLPLISESLALLEPMRRWQVTYNTYFVSLTAGSTCAWRCCIQDSDAHREAQRGHRGVILDLTQPLPAPSGQLADLARNGWGKADALPLRQEPAKKSSFVVMGSRNINQLNLKPRLK